MKRLIVLVSALLLVSMVAIASDVTFSGEVEMKWMNDFNNKKYTEDPQAEFKVNAVVDDTASVYLEIEEDSSGIGTGSAFDKAYFDLDLGAIFMLPVGVTIRTGWDEYDQFDAAKVTVGEYEDVIGSDIQQWGHEINVAVNDMIAVRVLWANDPSLEYYSAGVAVTYDPVYVEVSYVNIGSNTKKTYPGGVVTGVEDPGKGDIEVGSEFNMDVASGINVAAAVDLDYDLEEDDPASPSVGDPVWTLGVGAAVTYNDMVTLGLAFKGMTDSEANSMQVDLSATPLEGITVFLIAGLGLDDDPVLGYKETFESFEGSVQFMIGPSTWYAGMLWIADAGLYPKHGIAAEKADFGPEDSDTMAIFMRAELKY